jgi:3-isopropylmalate dehydrogenase
MVKKPESFEVIVTNNMFGDIVTDLGAALQGGLGVAGSANLHPGRTSMFEPVHGSAPKYAGTGQANPVGAVLSVALMLETLGHTEAAAVVEETVAESLRSGQSTRDVGGSLTTGELGDLLTRAVAGLPSARCR